MITEDYKRYRLSVGLYTESAFLKNDLGFGGSSSFVYDEALDILEKRNSDVIDITAMAEKSTECEENRALGVFEIDNEDLIASMSEKEARTRKKAYCVNKSKVQARAWALFSLKQSRKVLNFITVSFPRGLPDSVAYQAFNTWLTRLRTEMKLKLYLWVAERQKNGTIHYHILVPQYLNVRIINYKMSKCIEYLIKKENLLSLNFDRKTYNGVDLKRVENNKAALAAYVTKYVSKSVETFEHLAWHCSRAVSSLFVNYTADYVEKVFDLTGNQQISEKFYQNEFALFGYLTDRARGAFLRHLTRLNERVLLALGVM